ncbi:hypothetical protein [Nocardia gipuzkoensis]|nr:hypothetical protein [Nocardia gipuzkoensis]
MAAQASEHRPHPARWRRAGDIQDDYVDTVEQNRGGEGLTCCFLTADD